MAYQPKSYKKFVATAATATLVATAVVPAAFADEVTTAAFTDVAPQYQAAVDFVVEQAIAKGISETQFGISKEIIRGDAAIMIANAAGLNNPDAPASGFTDVPTRGALAINSLKAAGVTNGVSATSFDFSGDITRGEAAIFLANAFDLEGDVSNVKFTDVNSRYMAAVAALVDNGVTNGKTATQFGTDDNITRGDFARWLLALEEYIVPAPETTEVLSVEATDANTVTIKFNSALNVASAENEANYSVSSNSVSNASLSADGKTVTLTLGSLLENEEEVTVTVQSDLLTAAGEEFADVDFVKNIIFNDEVNPTVSAISTPNGALRIAFSEDLTDPTDTDEIAIVVDGQSLTLGAAEAAWVTGNVISIPKAEVDAEFGLTAGSKYSVAIAGAQDLVGNEMSLYTGSFTYQVVTDKTAPTVSAVAAEDEDTVNVKFSEEVSAPTASVKVDGVTVGSANYTLSTEDGVNYEISFAPEYDLFADGSTVKVDLTLSGAKDLGNNVMASTTKSVTLTEDTVAPKLVSSGYDADEEAVVLEFSEEIVNTEAGNIVIVNSNTSQIVDQTAEGVVINTVENEVFISGLDAGSYTVRVGAGEFADTSRAENTNAAFSTNVTVPAETAETVTVLDADANDDEIYVSFSDEVTGGSASTSAANPANYRLDGKALPAGTLIVLDSTSTVATLALPEGSIESTRTAILTVSNVKAENGTIVPTSSLLLDVEDTKTPELTTAEVDGTELVLSFSEAVFGADENDFIVRVNGVVVADADADSVAVDESTDELVITSDSVSFATGTITVEVVETTDIDDAEGNVLEVTTVTATR